MNSYEKVVASTGIKGIYTWNKNILKYSKENNLSVNQSMVISLFDKTFYLLSTFSFFKLLTYG